MVCCPLFTTVLVASRAKYPIRTNVKVTTSIVFTSILVKTIFGFVRVRRKTAISKTHHSLLVYSKSNRQYSLFDCFKNRGNRIIPAEHLVSRSPWWIPANNCDFIFHQFKNQNFGCVLWKISKLLFFNKICRRNISACGKTKRKPGAKTAQRK